MAFGDIAYYPPFSSVSDTFSRGSCSHPSPNRHPMCHLKKTENTSKPITETLPSCVALSQKFSVLQTLPAPYATSYPPCSFRFDCPLQAAEAASPRKSTRSPATTSAISIRSLGRRLNRRLWRRPVRPLGRRLVPGRGPGRRMLRKESDDFWNPESY